VKLRRVVVFGCVAIATLIVSCATAPSNQSGPAGQQWRDVGGGIRAYDVSVSTTCYAIGGGFQCVSHP
jgi:hypothetical protein